MMQVPENYAKPQQRKIQFPVVRFIANNPDPTKVPLLHLGAGGPGASMGLEAENASEWLWLNYAQMTTDAGRDLLIIDPRGTGMARPRLSCKEFIEDANIAYQRPLTVDEEFRVFSFSVERCYSRLSQTADLAQYNSATIARDVEALRQQLGLEKLNLYGVSYASRYALTLARDFPDSVRTLVLNSPVFPNILYVEYLAEDVVAAYQRAIAFCTKNKECNKQYTNLLKRLEDLVLTLDEQPLQVTTKHVNGSKFPFELTGQRLLQVLFYALYNENFYRQLPPIIAQLESGNGTLIQVATANFLSLALDPSFGDAAGVSHFCYEEAPFTDFDKARNSAIKNGLLAATARSAIDLMQVQCRIWALPPAAAIESKAIETPLPVLLLHGARDPILTATGVEKARHKLPNHQWLLFPELAHDIISASDCAEQAASRFLDDPQKPVTTEAKACRKEELARQKALLKKAEAQE